MDLKERVTRLEMCMMYNTQTMETKETTKNIKAIETKVKQIADGLGLVILVVIVLFGMGIVQYQTLIAIKE